jgi:cell division protein FtsB
LVKKLNTRNKRNRRANNVIKIAIFVLAIACIILLVVLQSDCAEKEADLVKLNEKISILEGENEEIQRKLNDMDDNDISSYMEQVALEEQGYAYPDERRFYDTSRD